MKAKTKKRRSPASYRRTVTPEQRRANRRKYTVLDTAHSTLLAMLRAGNNDTPANMVSKAFAIGEAMVEEFERRFPEDSADDPF